jgi:hypothetical protein
VVRNPPCEEVGTPHSTKQLGLGTTPCTLETVSGPFLHELRTHHDSSLARRAVRVSRQARSGTQGNHLCFKVDLHTLDRIAAGRYLQ